MRFHKEFAKILSTALVLVLTGCLASTRPLFNTGSLPLPGETLFRKMQDDKDGESVVARLVISNDWYVYQELGKEKSRQTFKLYQSGDRDWLVMFPMSSGSGDKTWAYSWLRRSGQSWTLYTFDTDTFAVWAANRTSSPRGWRKQGSRIVFSSLHPLLQMLPAMIDNGIYDDVFAYRRITERDLTRKESALLFVERRISQVNKKLKENEKQHKKLCGGRICMDSKSGQEVYRTEITDPPLWYYEDGRLAPQKDWPEYR